MTLGIKNNFVAQWDRAGERTGGTLSLAETGLSVDAGKLNPKAKFVVELSTLPDDEFADVTANMMWEAKRAYIVNKYPASYRYFFRAGEALKDNLLDKLQAAGADE